MPTATADPRSTTPPAGSKPAAKPLSSSIRDVAMQRVPAASFTAFRIAFGSLIAIGAFRFLWRGWVGEFYLAPDHHLAYAGFDWVRPLPDGLMYAHVVSLAGLGVSIAMGVRYRTAAALFAIGFAYTELIDAALYLNHYWFMTLMAVVLAVVPAPRAGTVPALTVWAIRAQLAVVYLFAGIAKLNPDWLLDAQPLRLWLSARTDRPIIGPWLGEPWVAYALSWAGALFDLTVVGWLLWRRSRPFAYVAVLAFHVATAMLFQIGLFPWVMIALTPIFFSPDWPTRVFGRAEPSVAAAPASSLRRFRAIALAILVVVNLALPLRHYAAEGNVRYNDDGYYLAWRVMLTERNGFVEYRLRDQSTGETWTERPDDFLNPWQSAQVLRRPDLVLTTAHLAAERAAAAGHDDVSVFADAWVSINGRSRERWIDPAVDLAALDRDASASSYVVAVGRS